MNERTQLDGLVLRADRQLIPLGYRRKRLAFSRTEAGILRLIDFQLGQHGGYFFVNVALHPLGLPKLSTRGLVVPKAPKEYECALRQRIDQIVPRERLGPAAGFFRLDDTKTVDVIVAALGEVHAWLGEWGNYGRLARASEEAISPMLTVVPRLKRKAFLMLKFFCLLRVGDTDTAAAVLEEYRGVTMVGLDFAHVDRYLESLFGQK